MADRGGNSLPYGHFGQGFYEPEEKIWRFARSPNHGYRFIPLGGVKLVHEPSIVEDHGVDELHHSNVPPSKRYPPLVQHLAKKLPEIQSASDFLPPLLRISEAVVSATTKHDSLRSSLLAFGSILHEGQKSARVAAFPCGAVGNDLRIVQIRSWKQGWHDSKHSWIEVPVVDGEEAVWRSEGPPIQQVRFAKALERSDDILAVRMINKTVIFRPILRGIPVKGVSSSRLDPNAVFELPINMTGGTSHADVAFNPWYVRQFGVIDRVGCWSVWELEGRHKITAKCVGKGRTSDEVASTVTAVADGWMRLNWICNPGIIAIATRKRLELTSVVAQAAPWRHLVLDVEATDTWILDVALLPSHPSYLCVLTSEHVRIYQVTRQGSDDPSVKVVLSSRHSRNPEDITASLTIQEDDERFTLVMRSSVDPMVTSFGVQIDETFGIVASDATELLLPENITGFRFEDARFGKTARHDTAEGMTEHCRRNGMSFQSLTYLGTDLALWQQLYIISPSMHVGSDVVAPSWEIQVFAKSSFKLPREKFVRSDDEEDADLVAADRERPCSAYVQRRRYQSNSKQKPERTLGFGLTAQVLARAGHRKVAHIDRIVKVPLESWQQNDSEVVLPPRTLREFLSGGVTVEDVDEASLQLEELVLLPPDDTLDKEDEAPTDESHTRPVLRHLTTPVPPNVNQETTLSSIYEDMMHDWTTPLDPEVSEETRVAKKQLVKQAAAEIALALRVVRMDAVEQQPLPESQDLQQQTYDLPVRGGMPPSSQMHPPSSQYLDFSSQLNSSQSALPTPSTSAGTSLATGSSHPSTLAPPPITRLSKYTTFSNPTTPALPRALRSVLSHWVISEDPTTYDWLSASRRETRRAEDEVDEQTMTEKERARVQRRAERHLRRQRKEAAASQASQFASIQALEISVSASQPQRMPAQVESQPTGMAVPSSQSFGLGGMPSASQVVPGRFGGRPPKKKRKQGF